jgi:hypothetical protein
MGLAGIARLVMECHSTQETGFRMRVDDVAGNICVPHPNAASATSPWSAGHASRASIARSPSRNPGLPYVLFQLALSAVCS